MSLNTRIHPFAKRRQHQRLQQQHTSQNQRDELMTEMEDVATTAAEGEEVRGGGAVMVDQASGCDLTSSSSTSGGIVKRNQQGLHRPVPPPPPQKQSLSADDDDSDCSTNYPCASTAKDTSNGMVVMSCPLSHRVGAVAKDGSTRISELFLRCIGLLNLAVQKYLADDSGAAGLIASKGPESSSRSSSIHKSSKVTLLRHSTRMARLATVAPVQLTVYKDCITIVDCNGVATHSMFLQQWDGDEGKGACGERPATCKRTVSTLSSERRTGGGHHDRSDEDQMLFVFREAATRERILSDVCHTYLPVQLEYVYPDGIVIEAQWLGDDLMPSLASLGWRLTETTFASTSSSSAATSTRQRTDDVYTQAKNRDDDDDDDDNAVVFSGFHRLGGTTSTSTTSTFTTTRIPDHAKVLSPPPLLSVENPATASTVTTTTTTTSTTSTGVSSPASQTRNEVVVYTPLGRYVYCRRSTMSETWSDVAEWLQRELHATKRRSRPCAYNDGGAPVANAAAATASISTESSSKKFCFRERGDGSKLLPHQEYVGVNGLAVVVNWNVQE